MSGSRVGEWDAEKLERAANHLKELDRSPNARAALELAKREQDVAIAREHARAKEAEVHRAEAQKQTERVRWEEQRRTMEAKAQNERVRSGSRPARGAG
jgi:ATPase family AAA domain-containing protein 3A/B